MTVLLELWDERPISVQLPEQVEATIVEADAVVKGQTASSSYKPAMLDNGVRVMVPPHIAAAPASSSTSTSAPTSARRAEPRIMAVVSGHHPRDGKGRPQGGGRAAPRLWRGRAPAGQPQGPGRLRLQGRPARRAHLWDELRAARPGWGFLMEEGGEIEGDPGKPRFIVDPLDGTSNFLHGIPHFAISIAVQEPKLDGKGWGE
jgi:hypothetical protein